MMRKCTEEIAYHTFALSFCAVLPTFAARMQVCGRIYYISAGGSPPLL